MRRLIISANLTKQAWKIYKQLIKVRKEYGWFSKWLSRKIIHDFGDKKNILKEQIIENQNEIDKLYKENKELAQQINKSK